MTSSRGNIKAVFMRTSVCFFAKLRDAALLFSRQPLFLEPEVPSSIDMDAICIHLVGKQNNKSEKIEKVQILLLKP